MRILLLLAVTLAAGRFGTVFAQSHDDAGHVHDTTGWTAPTPEGPITPADSLPAFRPDSLKDEAIRSVESRPSPFAGRPTAKDSADSVAALLRGRRPAVSIHVGVDFIDLDAKQVFSDALQARMTRDSLTPLQPYEPVHLAFPIGIQAIVPIGPWFDVVARTHSYWYKQTAVLGKSGITRGEESFASQAHLGGAGLRYYVPPSLLSVTGKLGLYIQGVYYWLLGGGELYTNHGAAPAEFDPAGSAWEIQLGFNRSMTKTIGITGNLGFLQQDFSSKRPWTDLVVDKAPAGNVHWSSGALQASFNLSYNFGIGPTPSTTQPPVSGPPASGAPPPEPPVSEPPVSEPPAPAKPPNPTPAPAPLPQGAAPAASPAK